MEYQKIIKRFRLPILSVGLTASLGFYLTKDPYKVIPGTLVGGALVTYLESKRKKKQSLTSAVSDERY